MRRDDEPHTGKQGRRRRSRRCMGQRSRSGARCKIGQKGGLSRWKPSKDILRLKKFQPKNGTALPFRRLHVGVRVPVRPGKIGFDLRGQRIAHAHLALHEGSRDRCDRPSFISGTGPWVEFGDGGLIEFLTELTGLPFSHGLVGNIPYTPIPGYDFLADPLGMCPGFMPHY